MSTDNFIFRSICAVLCICILLGTLCLASCSDEIPNDDPQSEDIKDDNSANDDTQEEDTENSADNNDTPDDLPDLAPEVIGASTTLHMIQRVERFENWQSGKTVYNAYFYVDDMMELLDSLEWKTSEQIAIVGDFHFRIDIDRPIEEISEFERFMLTTEPPLDTIFTVSEDHKSLVVQYLINFDAGVVSMKLLNYSMQIFNTYAELDDNQLKILELCFKTYFGPQNK